MMKRIKTLTVFLILSMVMVVAFTAIHILLQAYLGVALPQWLATLWFAFWGCEIFICAGLRKDKNRTAFETTTYGTEITSDSDAVG